MKTLIMHTLPPERCEGDRWEWEFDLQPTLDDMVTVLPEAAVAGVRGEPAELIEIVARERPDVVFNLCEAPLFNPRLEPHAAALLEWLGVPFTGSSSQTLALCRRKDLTKIILSAAGVPVPRANVFPSIVKPLDEDGSAGIREDSICETRADVERAVSRLVGPAMIEEFLPGREFALSMWGRTDPDHVVVGEIRYTEGVRLLAYEGKWDMESHVYLNAPLVFPEDVPRPLQTRLIEMAAVAWRAMALRGYATVDLRLDAEGTPRVIDVNANPALNSEGRVYRAIVQAGWTWRQFVHQQLEWAL